MFSLKEIAEWSASLRAMLIGKARLPQACKISVLAHSSDTKNITCLHFMLVLGNTHINMSTTFSYIIISNILKVDILISHMHYIWTLQ